MELAVTVLYSGKHYQAVDVGDEGGRHAVVKIGEGVILMTTPGQNERQIAIDTARALEREEKRKNSFLSIFGG